MGKAILFLVVVAVAVIGAIVYTCSSAMAPAVGTREQAASDSADETEQPANALRSATAQLGRQIKDKAKTAVGKAGALLEDKTTALKLDREVVEVKPGGKTEFKVTRTGGTKAARLELVPAPGSGLTATGGEFKDGQAQTTVIVQAPAGKAAQDAGLTIKAGDVVKVVPVKVR